MLSEPLLFIIRIIIQRNNLLLITFIVRHYHASLDIREHLAQARHRPRSSQIPEKGHVMVLSSKVHTKIASGSGRE